MMYKYTQQCENVFPKDLEAISYKDNYQER